MYTAESLKAIDDVNVLITLIEKGLGLELPAEAQILIAMSHGVSRRGGSIRVIDVSPDAPPAYDESLNYEKIAEILNRAPQPVVATEGGAP